MEPFSLDYIPLLSLDRSSLGYFFTNYPSKGRHVKCHSYFVKALNQKPLENSMRKREYLGWDKEQEQAKARRVLEIQEDVYRCSEKYDLDVAISCTSYILLLQSLNRFLMDNLLCDIGLELGDGTRYTVHRVVLASSSQYFRTLFTTSLNNNQLEDCFLPSITATSMEQIILYSYTNSINLTHDNVTDLLVACDYLGVMDVLKSCCEYIADRLAPENCIHIMIFARNFKDKFCRILAESAYRYLMSNFVSVSLKSVELMELNEREFKLIISSDELNIDNEEYVWNCILRWMKHDLPSRRWSMMSLLPHVRFGLMDPAFFLEQVRFHPWVLGKECRMFVINTMKFICDLDDTVEEIGKPRVSHEMMLAIGGWSNDQPTNQIEVYDCRRERWMIVDHVDPAGPRAYHGTAVIGTDVFVIGGFDGKQEYYSSCRRYDTLNKTWHETAPMNYRRCYVSVAVIGDSVYAMGGYDGHYRQNTAERFDPAANQWERIAPMHDQRSDASAAALNGRVYIAGGFNGVECVRTAEMFDPDSEQWTVIQHMTIRRSGVGCIAYHGFLYAVGGFDGTHRLDSSEKYDTRTKTWSKVPEMTDPRSNFGIGIIDGMLTVVGGFNGAATFPDVECFDYTSNTWYRRTSMAVHRSALSTCVLEGLPNVYNYIHKPNSRPWVNRNREKLLDLPIFETSNLVGDALHRTCESSD